MLLVTFVMLMRAFRSLVLPLQAVLLDLLSVAAAYGLLTLVVEHGLGAGILGIEQSGAVEAWVPIVLFAMLFGLSMDYEVFIVMPMREAWDGGADPAAAVTPRARQDRAHRHGRGRDHGRGVLGLRRRPGAGAAAVRARARARRPDRRNARAPVLVPSLVYLGAQSELVAARVGRTADPHGTVAATAAGRLRRGGASAPLPPDELLLDDRDRQPVGGQVVAGREARGVFREPEQRHHAELRVRVGGLLGVEQRVEVDQVRSRRARRQSTGSGRSRCC